MPGLHINTSPDRGETRMAHDLVIRGGRIADGSGADVFSGDIAINGNTITEEIGRASCRERVS